MVMLDYVWLYKGSKRYQISISQERWKCWTY